MTKNQKAISESRTGVNQVKISRKNIRNKWIHLCKDPNEGNFNELVENKEVNMTNTKYSCRNSAGRSNQSDAVIIHSKGKSLPLPDGTLQVSTQIVSWWNLLYMTWYSFYS